MSLLSLVRADLGRRCPVVMEGKIGLQLMPKVHSISKLHHLVARFSVVFRFSATKQTNKH
jgi:hypothetical protein